MTKFELQQKQIRLRNELEKVDKELERYETVFCIDDKQKPFKKYTIGELNDLICLNEKAFDYSQKHGDETILDYNLSVSKDKQVLLEK